MATETKHLMNAALTKPVEEFFLRVVTTMKLQDCSSVSLHFPPNSNLPSITLSFAEPKDGQEAESR